MQGQRRNERALVAGMDHGAVALECSRARNEFIGCQRRVQRELREIEIARKRFPHAREPMPFRTCDAAHIEKRRAFSCIFDQRRGRIEGIERAFP